ncbi:MULTISPECIES: hypothetical protein [Klebsiella]|uniref:hypothetical protein n=1 Tax=Klebsiella TaxID=570 RepID=UPI00287DD2C8|nr:MULTISPECIES: hypothetical protein [Klebsiella]MDS7878419.1 hypothetical protein [Klebsiella pasteurii]MDT8626675.1 hypothetical protein [Klebsiella grimontii]
MFKRSDITQAYRELMSVNTKGERYLHTRDFVSSLVCRGIHLSYSEANRWIERYQSCFADKTPNHTENRLWILRNMGRVM